MSSTCLQGSEGLAIHCESTAPKASAAFNCRIKIQEKKQLITQQIMHVGPTYKNGNHYTPAHVADRLEEAAAVLKRMPPVKVRGYFNVWPHILHELSDLIDQEPKKLNRPFPKASEISRMEETLGWTVGLEVLDAKVALLRARNYIWKEISYKVGIAEPNVRNHWAFGMCVISWKLNGRRLTANDSIQSVIRTTPFGERKKKPSKKRRFKKLKRRKI